MLPPDLVQCRLDVGWLAQERRGMTAIEAYVPGTRELLALEVHRLGLYDSLAHFLGEASKRQCDVLRDLFDPDPFP